MREVSTQHPADYAKHPWADSPLSSKDFEWNAGWRQMKSRGGQSEAALTEVGTGRTEQGTGPLLVGVVCGESCWVKWWLSWKEEGRLDEEWERRRMFYRVLALKDTEQGRLNSWEAEVPAPVREERRRSWTCMGRLRPKPLQELRPGKAAPQWKGNHLPTTSRSSV